MAKSYTLFLLRVFVSIAATSALLRAAEAADAPAIYIFGDSTFDVGTNNFIPECLARADFDYYGIDYPYSYPTGRFSNGFNTADEIVKLLGLKMSPPPFLYLVKHPSTFKRNILKGANFASGGSGIFYDTGLNLYKKVVPLEDQIQQFSTLRSNITNMTGSEAETDIILSEAFFLISIGSNDIIEYVLNPTPPVSEPEFTVSLISTYENHLKTLYILGARTFGILSVPPVGCTPFARARYNITLTDDGCDKQGDDLAKGFYIELAAFLEKFSKEVQDIRYSLGNTHLMTTTMMNDMLAFGFRNIAAACCGNGNYSCDQTATFCANRDEYLFWDRFHPTQKASQLAALTLFGASKTLVAPMNFSQLLGVNI